MVMIGILPTLEAGHLEPGTISPNPRYKLLSRPDPRRARRGPRHRHRAAPSGCRRPRSRSCPRPPARAPSCTPRSARTRSRRTGTPRRRSAASSSRVGANSPYLLGKQLWQETRIPLFEQATDTRSEELKEQGVRPRVWFGERWITSIFDLFEENVRYFPALLPITDDEDPLEVLEAGGTPELSELKLHNGTIYRWNRPVYDVVDGRAAPARREPRARGRPDRDRHDGQRRLLLRAGARAGRERAAAVVADVVLRGRGELPRGARSTASTPASTGPAWARWRRPSSCCAGCSRWPARASTSGAWSADEADRLLSIIEQRCVAAPQRRLLVRRDR